jgi:hypothetical protein
LAGWLTAYEAYTDRASIRTVTLLGQGVPSQPSSRPLPHLCIPLPISGGRVVGSNGRNLVLRRSRPPFAHSFIYQCILQFPSTQGLGVGGSAGTQADIVTSLIALDGNVGFGCRLENSDQLRCASLRSTRARSKELHGCRPFSTSLDALISRDESTTWLDIRVRQTPTTPFGCKGGHDLA